MGRHGHRLSNLAATLMITVLALVLVSSLPFWAPAPARAGAIVKVDVWMLNPTLFTPQGMTINLGDTVVWLDYDNIGHTVTAFPEQDESFSSGSLTEMTTFSHTFTHEGNFTYYSLAPEDAGSIGWVYVQQPVPEFPGLAVWFTLAASLGVAMTVSVMLRKSLKESAKGDRRTFRAPFNSFRSAFGGLELIAQRP